MNIARFDAEGDGKSCRVDEDSRSFVTACEQTNNADEAVLSSIVARHPIWFGSMGRSLL